MKNKLLNLIDKLDVNSQESISIQLEIEKIVDEEIADIRNKMSPINNLLALLENGIKDNKIVIEETLSKYIISELEKSKKSISYICKK